MYFRLRNFVRRMQICVHKVRENIPVLEIASIALKNSGLSVSEIERVHEREQREVLCYVDLQNSTSLVSQLQGNGSCELRFQREYVSCV